MIKPLLLLQNAEEIDAAAVAQEASGIVVADDVVVFFDVSCDGDEIR